MSVRQQEFRKLLLVFGFVLLFFGMAIFAAGAVSAESPAKDHISNETISINDSVNESVFVDVEFAEESTAYVVLESPDGTEFGNETLNSLGGITKTAEFNVTENGTYTASISGNPSAVEQIWVSASAEQSGDGILAGGAGGSSSSIPWAVAAAVALSLAVAVGLLTRVDL